jgi:putative ribosome biogenesis GTPase RsgA
VLPNSKKCASRTDEETLGNLFFLSASFCRCRRAERAATVTILLTMAPGTATKQRDYDYLFKLVLIGDSGVGKSCLLLRFAVSK